MAVSMFKFFGDARFYAHSETEQEDRSAAVFYAFGRKDGGGDIFQVDGAFRFADEWALAARFAGQQPEMRKQGLKPAFEEWMKDGRVSVVNRWTHMRVTVPTD